MTDSDIRRRVTSSIRNSPTLDSFGVLVGVRDQVVTLSGTVSTYSERLGAQELAEASAGVGKVSNSISVTQSGAEWSITDDQIAHHVRIALALLSSQMDVSRLRFTVACHVVTVDGQLSSAPERALVRHAIESARGVSFVENHVEVTA